MNIRPERRAERGVVLILLALMATVVFGFIGLALDTGNLYWTRVRAQTAADAAAIGALREYQRGAGDGAIVNAGRIDASMNGFTNDANKTSVAVNRPPAEGSLAGNPGAVEVVVRRTVPSLLLRFIGTERSTVAARAVAKLGWGGGCIYALNKTAADSLQFGGSQTTTIACDALVASANSSAFGMHGSSILYTSNNARVGVVGGWVFDGGTGIRDAATGATRLPARIESVLDPFAAREEPSMTGLAVRSAKKADANFSAVNPPPGNTIPPGIYCGGLSVGNTQGATFNMSGLYVMAGGGVNFGSGARVGGSNVTIYLTSGERSGAAGCNAAYDAIDMNAQAEVNLWAPVSGPLEGMLIFQDRGIIDTTNHKINGGATSQFNGSIYLRNSPLIFNGNSSAQSYLILVADKINVTGNTSVYADYSALESGAPVKTLPTLQE